MSKSDSSLGLLIWYKLFSMSLWLSFPPNVGCFYKDIPPTLDIDDIDMLKSDSCLGLSTWP